MTGFNQPGSFGTQSLMYYMLAQAMLGQAGGIDIRDKFGRNADIDTGSDPEDIIGGGGLYAGQPTGAAETVEVFSDDINDTLAGSGARSVRLFGLDENWEEQSEDVDLDGTTPVVTSGLWQRMPRGVVLEAGSGGGNAGTITARHTATTANVFFNLQSGQNQTAVCAFTIPKGKTGIMMWYHPTMARNATAGFTAVQLLIKEQGGVYNVKDFFDLHSSAVAPPRNMFPGIMTEMSDVIVRVNQVSANNTAVSCRVVYLLLDNEAFNL